MHRIRRGGDEIEFQKEAPGFLVLRMDRESANASNIGRLQRAQHRVLQQCLAQTLALPAVIHCQAREQHDRNRMARQSFSQTLGRFLPRHVTHGKRVIADDGIAREPYIGLRCTCLLVLPRVAWQIAVQFFPAAVKALNRVIGAELFNAASFVH